MKLHELFESTDLSGYVDMLNDIGMFITLNTSMIQQYAKDEPSKKELKDMQQHLKDPILNGMNFIEVHSKPQLYKMPTIIARMLKYTYDLIKYVEPRIQRYVKPEAVHKFQDRIDNIKKQYKEQVLLLGK
jgi:Na+/phosphate symporter